MGVFGVSGMDGGGAAIGALCDCNVVVMLFLSESEAPEQRQNARGVRRDAALVGQA